MKCIDSPPDFASRYELQRLLGEGAMGSVHLAHDRTHGRLVAIKLLKDVLPDARQRFVREAKVLARLDHPRIVAVYDSGETDGQLYLACEFVDGETLADLLKRESPLALETALVLGDALLEALSYAHAQGIVHRDVKPANILLPRAGGLKLADFGLAKGAAPGSGLPSLTEANTIMGTPAYISPEQARGERPGPASDLYSAGVTIFELLTGRLPFQAATPLELIAMHTREHPPDARSVRKAIPAAVSRVVAKSLQKTLDARWSSADAFREALRSAAIAKQAPSLTIDPDVPTGLIVGDQTIESRAAASNAEIETAVTLMPTALGPSPVALESFEPVAPDPPSPAGWLPPYALLLLPLALVGTVGGLALHTLSTRPGPSPRASPPATTGELATMSTALDASRFTGLLVHWKGTVRDVGDRRTRIVVESDGHRFSVKLEAPLAPDIGPGSLVDVDGVVLDRGAPLGGRPSAVMLMGRDVRLAATPAAARSSASEHSQK